MSLDKPYYRCYRPNIGSSSLEYLRDSRNVEHPYDYIRKIEILYSRLEKIFEYIEPCDSNSQVFSIQTSSLLLDVCTTVEANFRAVLEINDYKRSKKMLHEEDMKHWNADDYIKINKSHHLSSYEIKIPFWKGEKACRKPFDIWDTNGKLTWYEAYNLVKHNIIEEVKNATLDNLVDAFCGLLVITSAQFYDSSIRTPPDLAMSSLLGDGSIYKNSYESAIGDKLLIKFPYDWTNDEKYNFDSVGFYRNNLDFVKYAYNK